MNISTIQTTDSSSSNNDIVEMMDSFSLKRKRTIKWGNDVIDTEANDFSEVNDIYHTRKKTPKKTNNIIIDSSRKNPHNRKNIFKVIHPGNCN